ncbi:MAG: hypothetical protein ACJ8KC_00355 [Candidatus Udaeobacter sp.]
MAEGALPSLSAVAPFSEFDPSTSQARGVVSEEHKPLWEKNARAAEDHQISTTIKSDVGSEHFHLTAVS